MLNTDGCLALLFFGMLSVTFRTVCSMTLDRTCMNKYLGLTEETDWQAQKYRPNSSESFTKFWNSVTEESNVENVNARTHGNCFHLFISR